MSFTIGWKNLWNQDDSLEETPEDMRREFIDEVLQELRSKYRRRTKKNDLGDFEIAKWDGENNVIAVYPHLSQKTAEELKEIMTMILGFGQVTNVNVFADRQLVDIYGVEARKQAFKQEWKEQQELKE